MLLTLFVWTGAHRLYKLPSIPKKGRPNYLLIMIIAAVSLIVAIVSPQKSAAEILFILAPIAIMAANYIEFSDSANRGLNEKKWFKEIILWVTLLLPLTLFFY